LIWAALSIDRDRFRMETMWQFSQKCAYLGSHEQILGAGIEIECKQWLW